MNKNSFVFGDKTVFRNGYIVCPIIFTTVNRKFIIMLLFVGSFGVAVGYAQPTTKPNADPSTPAPALKKDVAPSDVKKDELSKKLLQRKMQLDNERIKPAETVQPTTRKDNKPADKPKGDKK